MVYVALFARAWIEIDMGAWYDIVLKVALFARAWIEIILYSIKYLKIIVALFARAWIEISSDITPPACRSRRPLCEGVD